MKCVLDNESLKTFSKIILTCIKLGDEIFFECNLNEFIIKTVNDEQTLYFFAKFKFNFFFEYQIVDFLECKLKSKSCLLPFKTPNFLEKNVSTCSLEFESDVESASIVLNCENDVQFFYDLPIILTNLIIEVDNESQFQDYILLKIRHFLNVFNNFPNSTEYCIMRANGEKVFFESYDFNKDGIKTNFCLNSSEFLDYKVTEEITITFSLKPLKTFLNSLDKQANCLMYLEGNYLPIHIVIKHQKIETKLIVASLDIEPESKTVSTTNISSIKDYNNIESGLTNDYGENQNCEISFSMSKSISKAFSSNNLENLTNKLNDENQSEDNVLINENNYNYKNNDDSEKKSLNIEIEEKEDLNILSNICVTFNSNLSNEKNCEMDIKNTINESVLNDNYQMDDANDFNFEIETVTKTPENSFVSSITNTTQISQIKSDETNKISLKQQYCKALQEIPVLLGKNLTDNEEDNHFKKFLIEYKHFLP